MGEENLALFIGVIFIVVMLIFLSELGSAFPQDGSGIYSGQCTGSRQISRNNEFLEASSDWNFQYSGVLDQWDGEGNYEKVSQGYSDYSEVDYTQYQTVTEVWNENQGHMVCSVKRWVDSSGKDETDEEVCYNYNYGNAVDQILTMIRGDANVVHEEIGSECNGQVITYRDSIDYPYGSFDYLDAQGSWYFDKAECTYTKGFCNPIYPVALGVSVDLLLCRGECISAYSEESKKISYSEIFPPKLNCSFYVGDSDSDDEDSVQVDVKFKKGDGSASEVLHEESKQCKNKQDCSLVLQTSETSNIQPGDNVWCEVTPTDKDGNKGELSEWDILLPRIDLFIDNVNFFNSINFAPLTSSNGAIPILVKEKPFGIKFCPSFSSDLPGLTRLDIPIDYILKFNNAAEVPVVSSSDLKIYKTKDELRNQVKDAIINFGSIVGVGEEISRLKEIKKGEDCVVKLGLKQEEIVPESSIFWYELEVDSNNQILESEEGNNIKEGAIFSPESKSLSLQYHTIVLEDEKTGEFVPANEQTVSRGVNNIKQSYEFIRRVFPIASEKLWLYGLGNSEDESVLQMLREIVPKIHTSLKIQTDNLEEIYMPVSFPPTLSDEEFALEEEKALDKADEVRREILKELRPFAKKYGEGKPQEKDNEIIVVGIVPREVLSIKRNGRVISASGLAYPEFNIVLIEYDADYGTLAHEVGHCAGLYLKSEEYEIVPWFGDVASDGWCLDPDTGESCGGLWGDAIVNIWDEKSTSMQNKFSLSDVWEEDFYSGEIKDSIDMGKRYIDVMGSALGKNRWVSIDTYKELADKYTRGVLA